MNTKIKLFFIFLCFSGEFFAQEKRELEKPVNHEKVPQAAKNYVCELLPDAKIRWIYEVSGEMETYEAKAKSNGERYSVEFELSGKLSDVEKLIRNEEIDEATLKRIDSLLSGDFEKFRLSRIQHHYSGNQQEVMKLLKNQKANAEAIIQLYEIEVKGLNREGLQHYQYTFSLQGKLIDKIKIAEPMQDNLFY